MENNNFKPFENTDSVRAGFIFSVKEDNFAPNEQQAKIAYNKLCDMWNKNEKSRNFVKHIIGAFLPYQMLNKVMNFKDEIGKYDEKGVLKEKYDNQNRCAILGIRLSGLRRITLYLSNISMKHMFIKAAMCVENRKATLKEQKEINDIRRQYPIEVISGTYAYFSENSDKFLSKDAMYSLTLFTSNMILYGCSEIVFTVNKRRMTLNQENVKDKKLRLTKNEINNVVKRTTYGIGNRLDETTLNALNKMKQQIKSEENNEY